MTSPLVSTEWLASRLGDPGQTSTSGSIIPVDASWHMPDSQRNAEKEYNEAHIPGAVFFDIDENSHKASSLPHTLPRVDQFEKSVRKLGISNDDILVIYDDSDVRSAARVWWHFRVMGHREVYVLDGGLRKWHAEGRPLTSAPTSSEPTMYQARFMPALMRTTDDILMTLKSRKEQVVDARACARFEGTVAEPRKGLRSGHIPHARNIPFAALFADDNTLLPTEELRTKIEAAGVDMSKPVITSCGSGITACVLKLAFASLGKQDVAIYDGSWSEWGSDIGLPIETGPAESI
ncbi:3-mercaptopyruvate sulfurtransferase [Kordiimonas aestuarii]|uniref:3-mercaptopyruvate sulfurtransferase n=1 Tax=Kordiimonas aestuarii TaxID=1005925 RepID=UPI0021D3B2D0|nr:3-mercaptopyruvate sulfurtransferase [Kordiimonas aestuarii]